VAADWHGPMLLQHIMMLYICSDERTGPAVRPADTSAPSQPYLAFTRRLVNIE